mmetsp:Transcript_37273/g.89322  ORF Transcript_37273/g.89322 Transcript_37273/m.89322 type:complete len:96 (+) Transcript_37273:611-898(+)
MPSGSRVCMLAQPELQLRAASLLHLSDRSNSSACFAPQAGKRTLKEAAVGDPRHGPIPQPRRQLQLVLSTDGEASDHRFSGTSVCLCPLPTGAAS